MNEPDINARDRLGRTALLWAAWRKGPEATRRLLERGADINARDSYQWTPLMVAVRAEQMETVCLLLEHGADVEGEDVHGESVLTMALQLKDGTIAQLLRDVGAQEPPRVVAARRSGVNALPTLRIEKERWKQSERIRFWIGVSRLTREPIPEALWTTMRIHYLLPDGSRRTESVAWPRDGQLDAGWEGGWGFGRQVPDIGVYRLSFEFAGLQTEPVTLVVEAD